ncbi:hypothetical protein M3Y96_00135000 [Aphelenchoides besseyi]|nr:hypothetical protein M3Y96_00135000 [Aphelenchoides besseyi]
MQKCKFDISVEINKLVFRARSSHLREIRRRKGLPERQSLRQIQRSIHQKNSANTLKKMMATKAKRNDSAMKVAAAKREITKKVAESLNKELADVKADFESKKKVNAEIAALDATTPKVKSKSLKVGPTQSEAFTACDFSTATTTKTTTTDVTTDATTEEAITGAQTTNDTRSVI